MVTRNSEVRQTCKFRTLRESNPVASKYKKTLVHNRIESFLDLTLFGFQTRKFAHNLQVSVDWEGGLCLGPTATGRVPGAIHHQRT